MSLIHNEQTKLTATYLNGVAIAALAIGAFAPIASFISAQTSELSLSVVLFALGCLLVSGSLHFAARRTLERMIP